jgi:Domain of unknown function (DUF6894)
MSRFYFHISTIEDVFPDEEGVELADLAAAHDCAMKIMYRTMLSDPEEQDWRGWMIKIADAKCRTLLTLLYPARKPIPRKTFGLRTGFSRAPLLGVVGCTVLLGLPDIHSAAASSLSFVKSGASFTCVYNSGNRNGVARTLDVRHSKAAEQDTGSTERERDWIARCRPVIRQDRYGVGRYHYSAPGCEFGKSGD